VSADALGSRREAWGRLWWVLRFAGTASCEERKPSSSQRQELSPVAGVLRQLLLERRGYTR
jgi:hypothetical protein